MISRQEAENYLTAKNAKKEQTNDVMRHQKRRRVYVNAIFEINDELELPSTKLELVQLLKQGKAIPFHKWVCPVCHTIPKFDKWQRQDLLSGELQQIN